MTVWHWGIAAVIAIVAVLQLAHELELRGGAVGVFGKRLAGWFLALLFLAFVFALYWFGGDAGNGGPSYRGMDLVE